MSSYLYSDISGLQMCLFGDRLDITVESLGFIEIYSKVSKVITQKLYLLCIISVLRRCVNVIFALLECYAA